MAKSISDKKLNKTGDLPDIPDYDNNDIEDKNIITILQRCWYLSFFKLCIDNEYTLNYNKNNKNK